MTTDPTATSETITLPITLQPVGVHYCLTHHGLRESDEDGGCAWHDDAMDERCQFVDLFPGTEVVGTYLDPMYEEDDDAL